MRCHEARRLMDAYLDSELDAKTSCDVEDHIRACAECGRYFRAEEELETTITGCLCAEGKDENLWRTIEAQCADAPRLRVLPRLRKRTAWVATVAAAAATIVIGFGMFWTARASNLELGPEVARRHQAYLDGIVEPSFVCSKGQDISAQCQGRLDGDAFTVLPGCPKFKTVGGKICRIGDTPVAWTLATREGIPMSVISFRRSELSHFPETQKRLASGGTLVCCKEGRFQVVIRVVDDYVIVAVAEAPEDLMEALVASAHHVPDRDGHS